MIAIVGLLLVLRRRSPRRLICQPEARLRFYADILDSICAAQRFHTFREG